MYQRAALLVKILDDEGGKWMVRWEEHGVGSSVRELCVLEATAASQETVRRDEEVELSNERVLSLVGQAP